MNEGHFNFIFYLTQYNPVEILPFQHVINIKNCKQFSLCFSLWGLQNPVFIIYQQHVSIPNTKFSMMVVKCGSTKAIKLSLMEEYFTQFVFKLKFKKVKWSLKFSASTSLATFPALTVQVTLTAKVMDDFMSTRPASGLPRLNTIISGCVYGSDSGWVSIWISSHPKADCSLQCGWASTNQRLAQNKKVHPPLK